MTKDRSPAFGHGNPAQGGHPGMTLRQYYAGQALTGILAAMGGTFGNSGAPKKEIYEVIAQFSFDQADAMLNRERQENE